MRFLKALRATAATAARDPHWWNDRAGSAIEPEATPRKIFRQIGARLAALIARIRRRSPAHGAPFVFVVNRRAARDLVAIGREWVFQFGIHQVEDCGDPLKAVAHVDRREVFAPWPPSSLDDLFVLAHEIAHVVLRHRYESGTEYIIEFEAERFAVELFRQYGLKAPRRQIRRARANVCAWLLLAVVRGEYRIDRAIDEWSRAYVCFDHRCTAGNFHIAGAVERVRAALAADKSSRGHKPGRIT